jgi:hypothetical protein
MYCILDTASEATSASIKAADTRIEPPAKSEPLAGRNEVVPAAVCLTEFHSSWTGSSYFEQRWTSLAA